MIIDVHSDNITIKLLPAPFLFFLITPQPPRSTLFPYTTLFRSDIKPVEAYPRQADPPRQQLYKDAETRGHRLLSAGKEIGRAHVCTPVTDVTRMPSSA